MARAHRNRPPVGWLNVGSPGMASENVPSPVSWSSPMKISVPTPAARRPGTSTRPIAQVTAFAISSSLFAMFLYLTLYMQNVLGLSPLQTGVRFLPLSVISFIAAPIAGRLSTRVPIRWLLGSGLALVALSMWLMSGITTSSDWTTLLPGFVIGGIGIGMVNAPLASTAVSTVQGRACRNGIGDQQHVSTTGDRHRYRSARRGVREPRVRQGGRGAPMASRTRIGSPASSRAARLRA